MLNRGTSLCFLFQVVDAGRRDRASCDVCRTRGGIARFCAACDWDICDGCFATVCVFSAAPLLPASPGLPFLLSLGVTP